jgi:DNA-binding LacI/PurR family transcriptional regulator
MTHPTIRDVAQRAGVGIGTVSRVLNNSPRVTASTRRAVLDAIAALGYKPNTLARQLPRKTRIRNIGVITQLFVSYRSFAERLRGVQLALNDIDHSYELVLYNVRSTPHYDERLRSILQTGQVEGLIIIDLDLTPEQLELLQAANLPFIGVNHFQGRSWPCIGSNNIQGGQMATEYLLSLGHRRIAYVGDEFVDVFYAFNTSYERYTGFSQVMESHGLNVPDHYLCLAPHDYDAARASAAELFRQPDLPTAIFAMSDMQALACIAAAEEAGLRVPADLSIIGYDDLEISYHTRLTTVRQHLQESGRLAIEYLLKRLTGENLPVPVVPPLELIARQTTRPYVTRTGKAQV